MTRIYLGVAVALVCWSAPPAGAWWRPGHEHMSEGAVSHLPPGLQWFFEDNIDAVRTYSGDEPPRPPEHYIDIDLYPGWPGTPIIRDLQQAEDTYGADFVANAGTAPWAVADHTVELSDQMLAATTEQDWLDLLVTAGQLAHYIEDLHNPLHLTENYNGQNTGNYGIHARYEGYMINAYLDQLTISPAPSACQYQASMIDTIFDSIEGAGADPGNYPFVNDIMDADDIAHAVDPSEGDDYYAALWLNTAFTPALFQDASEMVASAWYTAWVDAGSPTPVPEPATSGLVLFGALMLLRQRRHKERPR